jgi:hypothetical protein
VRLVGVRRALLLIVVLTGVAQASPPPPPEPEPEATRPAIEWSTWFRVGFGMRPADPGPIARSSTPPTVSRGQEATYDAALGIDVTASASRSGNGRVGAWAEVRGLSLVGGGELVFQGLPKKIDLFWYEGTGVLALRAGGNHEKLTGQIAYGYLAPWDLFADKPGGTTRYMIGVRFVATYTRAIDDPRDWQATIGLETEPVGAIRYLLGIRSWYH